MTITIDTDTIMFLMAIIGCVVLVFVIIVLKKVANLLSTLDSTINQNTANISLLVSKLPGIADNVDAVMDNAKDVSGVAVDVASDVLTAKEKIKSGLNTTASVTKIVKDTFR